MTTIKGIAKMTVPRYTAFHFSQSNPRGAGQGDVPALLRRVAQTIDELGDVEIGNLILHSEITSDGAQWPSITVYYHDRTDVEEQP
ncbi:MAG: hypothetical protein ACRDSR_13320 [Pseudonocardiaceae bacterium]